jgi:hypothetical protein
MEKGVGSMDDQYLRGTCILSGAVGYRVPIRSVARFSSVFEWKGTARFVTIF